MPNEIMSTFKGADFIHQIPCIKYTTPTTELLHLLPVKYKIFRKWLFLDSEVHPLVEQCKVLTQSAAVLQMSTIHHWSDRISPEDKKQEAVCKCCAHFQIWKLMNMNADDRELELNTCH